jgi:Bacterial Ig domain/Ig-like domain CHU_C associated/PKD-like domain
MKKIYLLIFSFAILSIGFGLPNLIKSDSVAKSPGKKVIPSKKQSPPKKPGKYVLKSKEKVISENQEKNLVSLLVPGITATKTVTVSGGGNAVPGSQLNYSVVINNAGTDATSVNFTDILANDLTLVAGSVKVTPIIVDDSYSCIGNVGINVPANSGLLANDVSPSGSPITATAINTAGTQGAVSVNPDGSFTFSPNAGFRGTTTFTYTASNGNFASTATVTVSVSNPIWFINASAAADGTGTLTLPFNSINSFNSTSLDQTGDIIYIYSGTYNAVTLTTALLGSQKIIGQGAVGTSLASLAGITVPSFSNALPGINGTRPQWNSSANPALNMQSVNEIYGVNITGSTGVTMSGNGFTSMKVRDVTLNNTSGQAINFSTGALDNIFTSVSSSGAAKGISVSNCTGSFQVTGTGTTAGSGGTIQSITTRGAEFSTASNITLANMNFTNANTSAAASSATDYSTANGAITLNNVSNVTLTKIAISGTTRERGITGKTISNFTLNGGSTITDCGDEVNEGCLYLQELTGNCNISDATLSKGSENIARVYNSSGTLTLNIGTDLTTTTFNDVQTQNANMGSPGALSALRSYCFIYTTSSTSTANTTLNVRNTSFLKAGTHGFKVISDGTGTTNANLKSCTFNNDNASFSPNDQGGSIEMTAFNSSNLNYNILNNTCRGKDIALINIVAQISSNAQGRINNNTVTHSGTVSAGNGINLSAEGNSNITTEVTGNTVSGMAAGVGIFATAIGGTGKMNATITGNIITITDPLASHNIQVQAGNSGSTFSNTLCANVANNVTSRIDLSNGVNYRVRALTTGTHRVYLQGTGATSAADVWASNGNTPSAATNVAQAGTFGTQIFSSTNASPPSLATCLTVTNPTYSAAPELTNNPNMIDDGMSVTSANGRVSAAQPNVGNEAKPVELEEENIPTNNNTESGQLQNSIASTNSGETVIINGTGSGFLLPAGKSTTVSFNATVAALPSSCVVTNQASVSGSNFSTINSNTTTTNIVVPTINTGSTISATSVCIGGSVNLAAVCPAGSNLNWFTAVSGGSSVSTSNTYSPTNITTPTSYYASCTIGSCESVRTLVGAVTINPLPTITTGASSDICAGATSFTIPYTTTTGTPTTYSISGTGITTVTNASLPATPIIVNLSSAATVSSYSYTLTVRNANGCVSSNVTGSVSVNPVPTITTTASAPICAGANSFTIPFTSTTGTPNTYSISGVGITSVTNGALGSSPIVVNLSSGASGSSISYILTVRNAGGCTSGNVNGSVTVNPIPTLTTSASPAICAGAPSFTIPYSSTSNSPTTYSISGAGITTVTDATLPATPITVILSSGATGSSISYTLTVKNANGCTSSNITGSVTVNPLPTITKSASPAICAGANTFTIPYTATTGTPTLYSVSGVGITTVTDVAFPASSPITVNLSSGASGSSISYILIVRNANGCLSNNVSGSVTVNSTPAPTSPTATPSNFTVSGTTTLTASGCSSPSTISWYDSSNPTVALPNNTPTISANKTFFARCTGTNTCVSVPSANVNVTYNPCTPLVSTPGNVGINWTGLVSTDWNNPCNWNPAWVPDATNSAVVIDLKTHQPTISGTVPSVKVIYVNSGATLTVASGGTLNASSTTAVLTLQGGNLINDGTINLSGGGTSVGLAIGATASITNRGTITTNNLYGASLQFGNLTFTNESTGIFNGDFKANNNILTLTNRGTINYGGGTYALSLGSAGSSVINDGTISIAGGSGISNPSGSTITNNACGKILMTTDLYENAGTTINAGLIQMPNLYNFTNTGTFTNNGVLKANTVSGITNNRMVITNACPIFTLAGSNNYTVSGIFTDAGATTSAGTYVSVGNKFTANNTIPTGIQTLYAQVTNGTCTFVVPFDFNNRKPTAVSISTANICVGSNVTLSATCSSGTVTWYGTASGTTPLGTGASFTYTPPSGTGQAFYAACETTNCNSGRTITSNFVNVNPIPNAPTVTLTSASVVCQPATLNLTASGCPGTVTWSDNSTGTSLTISAVGTYNVSATCTVNGCTSVSSTGNNGLVINAPISPNPSSDSPKCVGTTLAFNSAAGMASYAWSGPNSFTSSIQAPSISNVTSAAAGTYTLTVTSGSCTVSATTAVIINQLATASVTPSTQTICSAGLITTIAITGTGSSYSWTRDNNTTVTGIAASGSGDISGSLTNTTDAPITVTFTITPLGTCSGTTTTATVVVNPIPTVTASTPSQTICSGSNITGVTLSNQPQTVAFAPLAPNQSSDVVLVTPKQIEGIELSSPALGTIFNWTRDNTATVTGIGASGSGNISGILTNTTASPKTVTFTITPSYTNAGTTCIGTPITVTVTVNPLPASATITDTGTTFCTGSSTTLSAPADPNYTYAWQRSLTGIINPNSYSSFGGTAQTQVVTTSGNYRVIVTNQYNCLASDTTAVRFQDMLFNGSLGAGDAQQTGRMNRFAVLSTCAAPKSYPGDFTTSGARFYDSYTVTNPTNAPVCATIGVRSGCGTAIFSAAYLGSFNPASPGTNYLADPGSSFPLTSFYEVTIPANGTIVVVVHEVNPGTGCISYSLTVELPGITVAPTASSNSPICAGSTLNLTGTGTGTYSWSGPNGFTSTDQNPSIANATTLASGTYTISITNTNGCVSTATTAVTVNALLTASGSPSTQTICSGAAITTIAITGTGTSYSWTRDNTTAVTGIAASGSGDISGSLTNTTKDPLTVTFTITAVGGTCSGTTTTATVVVNPIPTVTASTLSQTICSGSNITGVTFNSSQQPASFTPTAPDPSSDVVPVAPKEIEGIELSTSAPGTIFNWTRDNTTTVTGIPASGSGNISGILTNTTNSPIMVTFTVTPSYTNAGTTCLGTPITVTVTVNPNPIIPTITDAGTTFCGGSSTTLTASADPTYTSYAWQRSLTGIANPNSFTAFGGTAQTQVVTTSGVYRVIVTNQYNCSASDTTAVRFQDMLFNGSLDAGDAQQTGRMNRFAVVSTCAAAKSYPGDFTTSGARFYDSYTVTNPTNAPVCATIGVRSGCGTSIFSAAYLGSFNPTSLSTNYLADHASSFPNTGFYEVTIPANGTIVVVVHEVNPGTGCGSYSVSVELPGVTIAPTVSSNSPICAGSNLNLTGTGTGTYSWSGPNGFTSADQNPSIANATTLASGTYTINVTNANGCVSTATTAVTVNSNPTATASSNSPICAGTSLNLTGGGVGTYTWTSTNGFTSTSESPTISNATVTSSGTYMLTVTNSNGCTSTATVEVTVKAKPAAPTITPPASLSVCSPSTLTLTASGCAGTVTWSEGAATGTSLTISAVGTYSISAACTVNGCSSDASTAVTGLEIKAKPAVPTVVAPATLSVCSPSTLTLTASGCAGTITWSEGAAIGTSLTLNAVGIYSVSATCTVNGCTSDASTAITGLEIKAKPSAPTILAPIQLETCSPGSLTLSTSCQTGTILWSDNSSASSLTVSTVGVYNFTAKCVLNGCESNVSTGVNLEIKQTPTIIEQPVNVSICQGNNATFSVISNDQNLTFEWQVDMGSGFVPVTASPVYSGENTATLSLAFPPIGYNGYHYRCILSRRGCSVTSKLAILNMAGSAEALNIVNISPISGTMEQQAVAFTVALNKILTGANVIYKSGNSIELLPGFEAQTGSVFKAIIQSPCANMSTSTIYKSLPKEIRK